MPRSFQTPMSGDRRGGQWPLLLTLIATAALTALSIDLYLPSIPSIARDLGTSTPVIQRSLSVFVVCFGLGQLAFGPLSDRFGRRRPLLLALTAYMIGGLLCAGADTSELFLVGRIIQALGACGGAVSFVAIARDHWHGAELTRVLAVTTSAAALAPMVAPLLGSYIEAQLGWRYGFVFLGLYTGFVGLAIRLVVPADHRGFARASESAAPARPLLAQLSAPEFVGPAVVHSLIFAGLFAFLVRGSEIVMQDFASSAWAFGLWFSANASIYAVTTAGSAALARRWGAGRLVAAGALVVLAGGLAMFVLAVLNLRGAGIGAWSFMVPIFLSTAGVGAVMPATTAAAMSALHGTAARGAALLGFVRFSVAAGVGVLVTEGPGAVSVALAFVVPAALAFVGHARISPDFPSRRPAETDADAGTPAHRSSTGKPTLAPATLGANPA